MTRRSVGRVTPRLHADSVAGTAIASQASGDRDEGACPANRFFSLTDNSEVDGQVAPTSDTDSLGPPRNRRRRLRLNWNSQGSNDRLGPVHQPRHQQVRAAGVLFHELARRVGAVPVGSPVPRIVLPVLEWLCEISAGVPDIHFNEGTLSTNVAVRTVWQALREAMRSWGVGQEADLQGCGVKVSQALSQGTTSLRGHRSTCCLKGAGLTQELRCWRQFL